MPLCCGECADVVEDFGSVTLYERGHPYDVLARLRDAGPVHKLSSAALGHDFWGVFTASEAQQVLVDDDTFLSGYGVFPWNGVHNPDPLRGSIVIASDGDHRKTTRTVMNGLFTNGAVAARKSRLAAVIEKPVLTRVNNGVFDFGTEIAWPAAMRIMSDLAGTGSGYTDQLGPHVLGVLGNMAPEIAQDRQEASTSYAAVAAILDEAIGSQDKLAPDNLIGRLETARLSGELSRRDVLANLIATIVGGTEAPRLVLTSVAVLLAREPMWLEAVSSGRVTLPGLVTELLRWTSPTTMIGRTVAKRVRLGGVDLLPGETVRIMVGAVCRDPAWYPDPDVFNPSRPNRSGLVFGHGPHRCIGAAVAREQIAILVDLLVRERLVVELAGQPTLSQSNAFVGHLCAPVRVIRKN
ncbi:cytochrome P450 [Saccharopolyspora spinosa]|uniref:Cytochrome P450 n=1 Tax=Saccharopolyspora spinosa TaxID=60894 RepID=A0A2N3Y5D3_SACSN|nr:cytochrome P450 [Saccharopolyspora spinosa]PKW18142.1 cytochrome P450 [Saccharopolyspora spinosa]